MLQDASGARKCRRILEIYHLRKTQGHQQTSGQAAWMAGVPNIRHFSMDMEHFSSLCLARLSNEYGSTFA